MTISSIVGKLLPVRLLLCLFAAWAAGCKKPATRPPPCDHGAGGPEVPQSDLSKLRTVFVIVLENANWSDVRGNPALPYLNRLIEAGAHEERYFNPPGVHPSEPNYLWMEGGTDYGIADDRDPAAHHFANSDHLVALLRKAHISWRGYQEGIGPDECPTASHGLYAAKHNPFVFFDDVTKDRRFCVAHNRPLEELAADLKSGKVARYNFITPDLCSDMHGAPQCPKPQRQGEAWLSTWVPRILESEAHQKGGVLFIVWDEGEGSDGPIGLIALSPLAKAGYAGREPLTHSAFLRTLQEIFRVGPLLCDAGKSPDLADLFDLR